MRYINKILGLSLILLGASSCSDYLEPERDNALLEDQVLENPTLAEGILLKAYQGLPNDIWDNLNLGVASDEATTNNINSNFLRMATGGWQANDTPVSDWDLAYKNIQYINLFLEKMNEGSWSFTSESLDELHAMRLMGEAHGLRAYYQFLLLQQHAGVSNNGQLLGFPISTNFLTKEDNLFLPRNTFQECVDQILDDCNIAIENIAASFEAFTGGSSLGGRIEGEDYAPGGPGVGYNDTNSGNTGNQYRTDDVDIGVSPQGGFNIGWTAAGEWLNYKVGRVYGGLYTITASLSSGAGNPGTIRVLIGPNSNALTEIATFTAERTGWNAYSDYTLKNVPIPDGSNQIMRIEFVDGALNFDYITFEKTDGPVEETAEFMGMEYLVTELEQAQGERWRNRISGNAARALKARVELYAASPAYAANSGGSWERAATAAGQFLADAGGLSALTADGLTFYRSSSNDDIIWANSRSNKLSWEEANFPPSLFGLGETNPSQNLVDAFPISNGYPITKVNSGYNPNLPYIDRDNRFNEYILFNGSNFKGNTINTYEGQETDGINSLITSTRTGYYLKKFMDENVNLAIGARTQTQHHYTHLRFTEVFLNYAEAANEAYGPDDDPNGFGFSARDVISALRGRAGISQPDAYLTSLTTKEQWRDLIRNERRIELAFEGHRFWDMRRWDEINDIQEPVKGIFWSVDQFNFDIRNIENRVYQDFMIYGPVPLDETLRYDIQQNRGW